MGNRAVVPTLLALVLAGGCGDESGGGAPGAGGTATGAAGGGGAGGVTCVDDPSAPAPSVSVAPSASLTLPTNRTELVAIASSPNGAIAGYSWTQTAGPADATLHHAAEATALAVGLVEGSYSFSVTVTDEKCREASASVEVLVEPEPAFPTTPIGQLRHLWAPVFKTGHTLPPLTYASCTWTSADGFAFETELVEKYGYAYSLHRAESYWNGLLDDPGSDVAQKVAKNAEDPARYKLSTSVIRPLWSWEEGRAVPYADYLQSDLPGRCSGCAPALLTADSTVPDAVTFSPAADPRFYELVGDDTAAPLAIYRDRGIELSVVLNLGEVGVGLSQGDCHGHHWDSDPAIVADAEQVLGGAPAPACDTAGWARYASDRYARSQQRITDKVLAALSPEAIYLYYRTEGNLNRERYGSWYDYAPWYEDTKLNSTLPNMSAYYAGDEPPYLFWDGSAWDENSDMLTGTLASVAWQLRAGSPLSYNWVSGGWPTATHPEVSPFDRYVGYLKALYLAGNIGAVAAWWSPGLWQSASSEWSCDPLVELGADALPDGLGQLVALGEVHALYSHFEDFLRHGSLVAGPGVQRWTVGFDAADQVPAYELACDPATKLCDRTLRVLARKHDERDEWIVVAWAASGPDATVTVELPDAGTLEVSCRAAGSFYHVTRGTNGLLAELVDVDALHPTNLLAP